MAFRFSCGIMWQVNWLINWLECYKITSFSWHSLDRILSFFTENIHLFLWWTLKKSSRQVGVAGNCGSHSVKILQLVRSGALWQKGRKKRRSRNTCNHKTHSKYPVVHFNLVTGNNFFPFLGALRKTKIANTLTTSVSVNIPKKPWRICLELAGLAASLPF